MQVKRNCNSCYNNGLYVYSDHNTPPCTSCSPSRKSYKPQTNYEHIQGMSIDELAGFLLDATDYNGCVKAEIMCEDYYDNCMESCTHDEFCFKKEFEVSREKILEWLNKPVVV